MTERIRVEVDGDSEDVRRELRAAAAEVKAFSGVVDKESKRATKLWQDAAGRWRDESGKFATAAQKAAAGVETHTRSLDRNRKATSSLSKEVSALNRNLLATRNVIGLVKPAALITGAGLAAGALNSAAAGAAALVASLSPLVGLAPAGAQALTAFGQAAGVAALAGGRLEKVLDEQKDALKELRKVASQGLLPGVEAGLEAARGNLSEVKGVVGETADELGRLAERAGELVGSDAWGKDIKTVGESNALVLERGGRAALDLADAARHVMVEATPLTEWLALSAARLANMVERELEVKRETGELADFFQEARDKADRLASIAGSLATGLKNVGLAAKPLGDDILEDLDTAADRWEDWTDSLEGQNELRAYFDNAKPTLYEAGRLVDDLATGFLQMGSNPHTAELIRQLRLELLPVLFDVVESTTSAFGPHLIDALVEVAKLFGHMAGSSGPLVVFVDAIGAAASAINSLLDDIPGLNEAVVTLAGGVGVYKALQIGATITGLRTIIGLLGKTGGASAAAGAAGAAGAGAGVLTKGSPLAAAGAGAGAGGLAGGLRGLAPKVLPRAVPAVAAYLTFAEVLKAANPDLEEIAQRLDQFNAPASGNTRLKQLTRDLDEAVKAGDVMKMRRIAAALEQITQASNQPGGDMLRDIARDIRVLATEKGYEQIRGQVKASAREFDLMREQTTGDIRAIRGAVSINAQRISADLGRHSERGKAALAANFRQAAEEVKKSMEDGKISTREGLKEIERLMTEALEVYGFTPRQARHMARNQGALAGAGNEGAAARAMKKAGGGWIGSPGERGRDEVPLGLPPGWAVLNAHHQAALGLAAGGLVPTLVGRGEYLAPPEEQGALDRMARAAGFAGLDGLFTRITRPHYMAAGGIVPVPGFPGELAAQSVLDEIAWVARTFGVRLTDAFGPGHKSPGHTRFGTAADFAGTDDAMTRAAHALARMGYLVGYDGTGGTQAWPGHGPGSHLHVEFGSRNGNLMDLAAITLDRVKWTGPGGALGAVGQGALDLVGAAANQRLEDVVLSALATPVAGGGPGGGARMGDAALRAVIAQALRHTGHYSPANAAALFRRVMQESGGDPDAVNDWDVNAQRGDPSVGLAQVIGSTFAAYRDPGLPNDRRHPLANLVAAINYMFARYGHIVDANGQGYARGGFVRAAQGLNTNEGTGRAPGRGTAGARRRKRRRRSRGASGLGRKQDLANLIAFADIWEGRLALAELNNVEGVASTFTDDLAELGTLESIYGSIVRKARKLGDWGSVRTYAGSLSSTRDRIKELRTPAAPATDSTADELAKQTTLATLRGQRVDELLRANYLQGLQFATLRDFAPLLGGRMVGSFAHGGRVPQTGMALVHRDEYVVPDPQGPYGSQLAAGGGAAGRLEVELVVRTVRGEVVEIVDQRIRQRAPGEASRQTGRSSRLIAAAPGR